MPRTTTGSPTGSPEPTFEATARRHASGAALVSVALAIALGGAWGAGASAQTPGASSGPAAAPVAVATPMPERIEAPPVLVFSPTERARTDLEILQAAIEAYRGQHFFRYPEAPSLEALIRMLGARRLLPAGFAPALSLTEFRADAKGYRITARIEGQLLTIETPERFNPFWSFLW